MTARPTGAVKDEATKDERGRLALLWYIQCLANDLSIHRANEADATQGLKELGACASAIIASEPDDPRTLVLAATCRACVESIQAQVDGAVPPGLSVADLMQRGSWPRTGGYSVSRLLELVAQGADLDSVSREARGLSAWSSLAHTAEEAGEIEVAALDEAICAVANVERMYGRLQRVMEAVARRLCPHPFGAVTKTPSYELRGWKGSSSVLREMALMAYYRGWRGQGVSREDRLDSAKLLIAVQHVLLELETQETKKLWSRISQLEPFQRQHDDDAGPIRNAPKAPRLRPDQTLPDMEEVIREIRASEMGRELQPLIHAAVSAETATARVVDLLRGETEPSTDNGGSAPRYYIKLGDDGATIITPDANRFPHKKLRGLEHIAMLVNQPNQPIAKVQMQGGKTTSKSSARAAVSRAIDVALKSIHQTQSDLCDHLDRGIHRSGNHCIYCPSPDMTVESNWKRA